MKSVSNFVSSKSLGSRRPNEKCARPDAAPPRVGLCLRRGVQRELLFWNCSRRQFPRASRRAANVRGMHNNVPWGRRVSRPWAHPRRRRSPVSREPNRRPLVKVLLFAYVAQRMHPLCPPNALLSSPVHSAPMSRWCSRDQTTREERGDDCRRT